MLSARARVRDAAVAAVAALVPSGLRIRAAQVLIASLAQGEAAPALRSLFRAADVLDASLNDAATRYDRGVHAKHRIIGYHDFFVGRIRPGESVLDIGCGNGAVAHSIATRAGAHVVGIDTDAANIAMARRRFRHADLEFIHGDALRDLPPRRFDTIVLSNVLEHLDRRPEFLREVTTRSGARRWLIRVPMLDRDWRPLLRKELGMGYFSDPTHVIEYTRGTFEEEMAAASLSIDYLRVNWGEVWAEVSAEA